MRAPNVAESFEMLQNFYPPLELAELFNGLSHIWGFRRCAHAITLDESGRKFSGLSHFMSGSDKV